MFLSQEVNLENFNVQTQVINFQTSNIMFSEMLVKKKGLFCGISYITFFPSELVKPIHLEVGTWFFNMVKL